MTTFIQGVADILQQGDKSLACNDKAGLGLVNQRGGFPQTQRRTATRLVLCRPQKIITSSPVNGAKLGVKAKGAMTISWVAVMIRRTFCISHHPSARPFIRHHFIDPEEARPKGTCTYYVHKISGFVSLSPCHIQKSAIFILLSTFWSLPPNQ